MCCKCWSQSWPIGRPRWTLVSALGPVIKAPADGKSELGGGVQLVATEWPLNRPPNLKTHNLREALSCARTPGESSSMWRCSQAEGKQELDVFWQPVSVGEVAAAGRETLSNILADLFLVCFPIVGIISTFLHVHPFGASIEYICSYLQRLDTKVRVTSVHKWCSY